MSVPILIALVLILLVLASIYGALVQAGERDIARDQRVRDMASIALLPSSNTCRCGHPRGDHVAGACICLVDDEIHPDEHDRDTGLCPCDAFHESGHSTTAVMLVVLGLMLAFGSELQRVPWQAGIALGLFVAFAGGMMITDRA